jgi:DNA repair photolyase
MSRKTFKGKGAQYNPKNRFLSQEIIWEEQELYERERPLTKVLIEHPTNILSHNTSPDIPFDYSINPYQGCEHGCSYCYARVTHEYWGLSSGLDFETKIIVKKNAPVLLKKKLSSNSWKGDLIMFSGNTDCYQPLERKYELTRQLLKICQHHRQALHIITKNHLVTRDIDILSQMSDTNLVNVIISITTLDEPLRRKLEPRTSTSVQRLNAVKELSASGIPVSVMMAPVIPGLNQTEMPEIMALAREMGAHDFNYATVRLNGTIGNVFEDWLQTHYPDRMDKVWNGVERLHGGKVSDQRFGTRMSGKGPEAKAISQLFHTLKRKYFHDRKMRSVDCSQFRRNDQISLF